jgi:hypothetical protein
VIYLDSSVALARLLDESRSPTDDFWSEIFTSSRLIEYEVFNRIQSRPDWAVRAGEAGHLLERVDMLGLAPEVLARALAPFPIPVCTLDALHLATMDFLRANGQTFAVATYDRRLAAGATALGFPLAAL